MALSKCRDSDTEDPKCLAGTGEGFQEQGALGLSPCIRPGHWTGPEWKSINYTVTHPAHLAATACPEAALPSRPPGSLSHSTIFQRNRKSTVQYFAAGASFGACSFRSKRPINNGLGADEGRGMRVREEVAKGREAERNQGSRQ